MQHYQKLLENLQKRIKSKNPSSSSPSNAPAASTSSTNPAAPASSSSSSSAASASSSEYTLDDLIHSEPALRDIQSVEARKTAFIKKLKLCSIVFEFSSSSSSSSSSDGDHPSKSSPSSSSPTKAQREAQLHLGREMKRTILLELVEYISQNKGWFCERVVPVALEMIGKNLFRSLPPPVYLDFDPDEDEPNFDAAWPHLQFVYEFFHRFVMSAEVKLIRKHVTKSFLLHMMDLFDSEDPREREYLKMILHRIYGRCMPFRSFIRRAINNVMYAVIYGSGSTHHGISEMLEILGSIINGFALPLKQEHTEFLRNVLIPMHKVATLRHFHAQLAYCITQFIQKDPQLSTTVIGGMLKYWPQTTCQKELLFLNELEEVLELTGKQQLVQVIEPLFGRVARSICSNHFQVAERALFLWNNDIIATFTSEHRARILPIIYPALHRNYSRHWNPTVSSLTLNIIRIFKEMDKTLYDEIAQKHRKEGADDDRKQEKRVKARQEKWMMIQAKSMVRAR